MKFNKFVVLLAFLFALIIAFGFYLFWNSETLLSGKHIIAIILSFLVSFVSLSSLAIKSTSKQRGNFMKNKVVEKSETDFEDMPISSDFSDRVVNLLKIISTLYLFISLVTIVILSIFVKTGANLIFAYGLLTVVFLLIGYSISKSGQ